MHFPVALSAPHCRSPASLNEAQICKGAQILISHRAVRRPRLVLRVPLQHTPRPPQHQPAFKAAFQACAAAAPRTPLSPYAHYCTAAVQPAFPATHLVRFALVCLPVIVTKATATVPQYSAMTQRTLHWYGLYGLPYIFRVLPNYQHAPASAPCTGLACTGRRWCSGGRCCGRAGRGEVESLGAVRLGCRTQAERQRKTPHPTPPPHPSPSPPSLALRTR